MIKTKTCSYVYISDVNGWGVGCFNVSGSYDNMRWLNTELSSIEISRFSSELFLYYLFTLGDLKLYLIVFSGVKL